MSFTLEISNERAMSPTVVVLINARLIRSFDKKISSGHQRAMARPASTAIGGAMGSRYWKPLVGQIWKKVAGTMIHHKSKRSRQDRSCLKNQIPRRAAMITRKPMASGTVLG